MKRIIAVLTVVLLIGSCFAGCNKASTPNYGPQELQEPLPQEQNFSKSGLRFTLPGDFTDYTGTAIGEGFTFLYANGDWGLYGNEHSKESEDFQDFAGFVSYQAGVLGAEAIQKDGFWTLTYQDDTKNETETCLCVFYEAEESYWAVTAYCRQDVFEIYQETMWKYATSATIK